METTNKSGNAEAQTSQETEKVKLNYCEAKDFFQGSQIIETKETEKICECGANETKTENGIDHICQNCGTRRAEPRETDEEWNAEQIRLEKEAGTNPNGEW